MPATFTLSVLKGSTRPIQLRLHRYAVWCTGLLMCGPMLTAALHANPANKCTLVQFQLARHTSGATISLGNCILTLETVYNMFQLGFTASLDLACLDLLLQALQDAESQLVPMKQAFFIEQPDG